MSEFGSKVNFKFDLVNKNQPYYNSWQRGNESVILLKNTTFSTALLTFQKLTIQLKNYQVSK